MLTTRDAVFWTFTGDGAAEVWQIVLPTLGLFRHGIFSVDTPVVDLANPGQTGVLATRNAVFIERTWRAQGGWMILPAVDFYTASLKSWTEVRVSASHVGAAGEIEVLYSTDPNALNDRNHDSWLTVARLRNGQTEMRVPMRGVSSRYLLLQVRWVRNADRSSPRLLAVSLVGRTDDRDMVQMRLPVIVSDRVERPYRTPARVRGYGQLLRQWLFDLKGATVNVELFRPELSVTGTVTAVEAPVQVINRRGQVLDVATVIVHGRRMTSLSSSQFGSQESLGLGLLGVRPVLGGVTEGA